LIFLNIFLWDNYFALAQKRDFFTTLVYARRLPLFGRLAYLTLKLLGIEIPRSVPIGKDFELAHGGYGVVIHSRSIIGDRVKIYPGVTIGRADIHRPMAESRFVEIIIEDDVILSPGSKVLCKEGVMSVRRGTLVGANAVLLNSTSPKEIWAGVPARCIGSRELDPEIGQERGQRG
jgi:serine O-acetyltransferase